MIFARSFASASLRFILFSLNWSFIWVSVTAVFSMPSVKVVSTASQESFNARTVSDNKLLQREEVAIIKVFCQIYIYKASNVKSLTTNTSTVK